MTPGYQHSPLASTIQMSSFCFSGEGQDTHTRVRTHAHTEADGRQADGSGGRILDGATCLLALSWSLVAPLD